MIDQVRYFAKLSSLAVVTLVKLYAVAMFSSIVSLVICLIILITYAPGAAPHASGAAAIVVLVTTRPWHCTLAMVIVLCGVLLVMLSGKYTISKVIHRLVSDKSEGTILPLMNKAIDKFRKERPAGMDKAATVTRSKLALIQQVKNGSGDRWVRRALVFAFKKAQLDDIDFAQDDLRLSDVIRDRTMQAIRDMSKPSKSLFWTVIAVQWLAVLLAYLI
jgi:hypothetical protein